ncbi:HAD hydrolase-like protein [Gleimia sp. 6138-11-ORH1]|uniref:HAD hydrolase-like protein n=1 Tax=Gleimia sp. 6138-11-ORH1 TaxID=2973937 RepID=UPI00216A5EFA|nr:HAD hydrolase-like protein [Gleimia sp. 6138-11-ORH1]MCS4484276.1 HAD hydrolase-like protein [Gleimia sp. 6138-11-ORH1]
MTNPIVIFDMDGTITDSAPLIMESINYTLVKLGRSAQLPAQLPRWVGPPLAVSFRDYAGFSADEVAVAIATYREHYAKHMFDVPLFPGIKELLENFQKAGVPLAIATSKLERLALPIVEELGLSKYFSYVCGAKDDGVNHAKADLVQEVLEFFRSQGTKFDCAYMIGDRIYDIEAGKANGIYTIGVSWAGSDLSEFAEATYIARTPADIFSFVLGK